MRPTRKNRVRQTHRWLEDNFPCTHPTKIRWVKHLPLLETEKTSKRAKDIGIYGINDGETVWLSLRACATIHEAVETCIHEYVHCLIPNEEPEHGDFFWIQYGRIYRAWEERGWKESQEY